MANAHLLSLAPGCIGLAQWPSLVRTCNPRQLAVSGRFLLILPGPPLGGLRFAVWFTEGGESNLVLLHTRAYFWGGGGQKHLLLPQKSRSPLAIIICLSICLFACSLLFLSCGKKKNKKKKKKHVIIISSWTGLDIYY